MIRNRIALTVIIATTSLSSAYAQVERIQLQPLSGRFYCRPITPGMATRIHTTRPAARSSPCSS